jgi:hypothetical protein
MSGYLSYPEDDYPDYVTYQEGDRIVYVGEPMDANHDEDMIGKTGTVEDVWDGDDETNPIVDVAWDDPDVDCEFDTVNPWFLARET